MSEREREAPALTVSTVGIDDPGDLTALLPPERQLLWLRRGDGLAGFGTALRWDFSGPSRMTDAAAAWRDLAGRALVADEVGLPGTGLVAFGTFAFAARSEAPSVLIVPEVVIGRRDGRAWMTRIGATDAPPPAPGDHAAAGAPGRRAVPATGIRFEPGALSPDAYLEAVSHGVTRIRAGELEKVVLARDLIGRLPAGGSIGGALEALAAGYPDCWTFAVDDFFGSSPETLVKVNDGTVSARVLAGSGARGTDAASDLDASVALATSAKDQDEHEYAVQSVLAALRPHSPGVTASDVPFTLRLPNLWHLASDVEGVLSDDSGSLDLAAALHPTAAVAGTPTANAVAAIEQLEPFDRGRYAGPVGWIGADGDGEWAIGLRCAQVGADGLVRAFAGAGIVADSVPEHELAETTMKFRPIVEALGA
ncbi:chorismate-binding protein [Leifsonia bigeumensis]|uniref:isochorismate synthase n=1 Tax=Leifsonella bigeumensis TaxID=433643 RepID=A0ABP7FCB8_9MICO